MIVIYAGTGKLYAVNVEQFGGEGVALIHGSWARGVVHVLTADGRVHVLLLDTGVLLDVYWRALREIHPKFCTTFALVSISNTQSTPHCTSHCI